MQRRGTVESGRQASGDRRLWVVLAFALVLGSAAWFYEDIVGVAQRRNGAPVPSGPASTPQAPTQSRIRSSAPAQEAPPPSPVATVATAAPATAKPMEELPPPPRLYPAPRAAPPPEGRAGLVVLLRSGALRPASGSDLARWKLRYAESQGHPPGRDFDERLNMVPIYVVTGEIIIPSGLNGANSVVFLLEPRTPYPAGDPGHSPILDMGSGSCIGVTCGMLLD